MFSALLFAWLQGAGFYKELHQYAVARIPPQTGGNWIEVGCGSGLMSRVAVEKGFSVTGIDLNRWSVWLARLISVLLRSNAQFEVGSQDVLMHRSAYVVSASSLLAVLDDKEAGIESLWHSVAPKGYLLIIEPTDRLNKMNVEALISKGKVSSKRIRGLRMWARAREGRTVSASVFDILAHALEDYSEALEGMVGVWVFRKP